MYSLFEEIDISLSAEMDEIAREGTSAFLNKTNIVYFYLFVERNPQENCHYLS